MVSGACAILSSTAWRENNAHKRLTEEASGADVFHTALNGASEKCLCACVCVCSLYAYEWDGKMKKTKQKTSF